MDIIWTQPAEESFSETILYIRKRMGDNIARKVWEMIGREVKLLSSNPYMGKVDEELSTVYRQYHFIIINKRSKVFYFIENEFIYIALVWDTRQDPQSLKYRLALFL